MESKILACHDSRFKLDRKKIQQKVKKQKKDAEALFSELSTAEREFFNYLFHQLLGGGKDIALSTLPFHLSQFQHTWHKQSSNTKQNTKTPKTGHNPTPAQRG